MVRWRQNYFFKLSAFLTISACGVILIADRLDAETHSKEQANCDGKIIPMVLSGGHSLGYQINVDADYPLKNLGNTDHSNVSVIRRMFGPPRSKPTAVLIADTLGNFEPEYHYKPGPGENGTAVYLPDDKIEDGRRSTEEFGLNDEVSKLIAMDRNVRDSRPNECKYWHYETDLPSASVVVIFHNEGFHTLLRTIHSIKNTSPARYLKEIIMVDDFSDKEVLKDKLDDYLKEHFGSLVKLHRNTKREGCIRARNIGASLATGEVVVFMDGHCECNKNWLVPLLARIAYDPTIMTVPVPDGIDQDTFAYQTYYDNGIHRQAIFDWALEYKEADVPKKDLKRREHYSEPYWSPTLVGYAMAVNRKFFFALGGFDPGLEIWGGEQFELSFKIWLCGGSVEWVPCSRVAHVFRRKRAYGWGNVDPKIPIVDVNLKRVAEVWMDPEHREYFYTRRPDMREYPVGDLTEQLALKKRLQCRSFKYFLDNFATAVLEANPPLPKNVAWGEVIWKDGSTDYCWERSFDSAEINVSLAKCHHWRGNQMFRFNVKGQIATDKFCVVAVGDALHAVNCPTQPTGDFQYEPVTRLIRHILTNTCVEGGEDSKSLRLRACSYNEIKQKWEVREDDPVASYYDLKTLDPFVSSIPEMVPSDKRVSVSRSEKELYDTAVQLYNEQKWQQSYEIFKEAWLAFNETQSAGLRHLVDEASILDFFQYTAFMVGKVLEAKLACFRAISHLNLATDQRDRLEGWYRHYDHLLKPVVQELKSMGKEVDSLPEEKLIHLAGQLTVLKEYEFCNDSFAEGALSKMAANPNLFCRFDNRNRNPILVLAPVKEEFLSLYPVVVIFHGLMQSGEMKMVKKLSEPHFQVTGFFNSTTQENDIKLDIRNTRLAWLDTSVMPKVTKRLEAYTGLNPFGDAAEPYQVGHFRIGGHYVPHLDHFGISESDSRIATLLIYLSNVEAGGGTIFTTLQMRVSAQEGSGLFWYNMHKDETADERMWHGACPVLRGEKWTMTKFFRWRGQLLHKPCTLTEQRSFTIDDSITPVYHFSQTNNI